MTPSIALANGIEMTLRSATPEDAEQLLAYLEQVAGESENITFGPGEFGLSVAEERQVLQQVAASPASLYVIAAINGTIAGTLNFMAGKRPRIKHAGEFGMTVLQQYWNMGIGSHLLTYLINWAEQSDTIRKINLRVRVDNAPAIHLYAKHGFVREGRITREFYLHGTFIDVFVMGLEINPSQ